MAKVMLVIVARVRTVSSMTDRPVDIPPDTKDWTWTLRRTCPECGFTAGEVQAGDIAARALALTQPWAEVLARGGVRERPAPGVWSPLEYGCHVRDVCRVFTERVNLMLSAESPQFANWDQDATAVEQRYHAQDPGEVAGELEEAAQGVAAAFGAVEGEQWQRRGFRSDGAEFTVTTLGQYFLHDLAHHLVDVKA
jgi:DinB family protein